MDDGDRCLRVTDRVGTRSKEPSCCAGPPAGRRFQVPLSGMACGCSRTGCQMARAQTRGPRKAGALGSPEPPDACLRVNEAAAFLLNFHLLLLIYIHHGSRRGHFRVEGQISSNVLNLLKRKGVDSPGRIRTSNISVNSQWSSFIKTCRKWG